MKYISKVTSLLILLVFLQFLSGCSRTAAVLKDNEDRALKKHIYELEKSVNPDAVYKGDSSHILDLPGAMVDDTLDVIGGVPEVIVAVPGLILYGIIHSLPDIMMGLSGSGF